MLARLRVRKLRAAVHDTKVRARSRAWRYAIAACGVLGAGLSAAMGPGDTPAAMAGIAAAVGVVAGPALVTATGFAWALASSWHHRPVSPLSATVDVSVDEAPPPGTPRDWPDDMQAEADEIGALLGRPFDESWTHARVVVHLRNEGPYRARNVDVLALRSGSEAPIPLSSGGPVRLRPWESTELRVFEAWECTYEIGTSGGIAHAQAITRRSGVRPSETVGLRVTAHGFPPIELALPAAAPAAEGKFVYLDTAIMDPGKPDGV